MDVSIYQEFEQNELGLLKDHEIQQTKNQNVLMETLKNKYVIQMKKPSQVKRAKSGKSGKSGNSVVAKGDGEKKMEKMEKTFEELLVQFQNMVQLNQIIQMNQMNQLQLMNQLIELKGSVVETRQDLSFKLKELNLRIDEIGTKRGSTTSRKSQEMTQEEHDEDSTHLHMIKMENSDSIHENRDIDEEYVKNLLKSKNPSALVKMFDLLYRCKDKSKCDIYPIRVIKAKTYQYYNEVGEWVLDTNGTNMMKLICSNIALLFSKINNQYYELEEFNMYDFIDNQNFIQELDDKKVKTQLLTSIRDTVVNHHMNRSKKAKSSEEVSIKNGD